MALCHHLSKRPRDSAIVLSHIAHPIFHITRHANSIRILSCKHNIINISLVIYRVTILCHFFLWYQLHMVSAQFIQGTPQPRSLHALALMPHLVTLMDAYSFILLPVSACIKEFTRMFIHSWGVRLCILQHRCSIFA